MGDGGSSWGGVVSVDVWMCGCVSVCEVGGWWLMVGFVVVRRALPHHFTHTCTPTQNADSCCRRIHDNKNKK